MKGGRFAWTAASLLHVFLLSNPPCLEHRWYFWIFNFRHKIAWFDSPRESRSHLWQSLLGHTGWREHRSSPADQLYEYNAVDVDGLYPHRHGFIHKYMDMHGILLDVSLWLWIMALAKLKCLNGWLTSEYWEQEGNCHCLWQQTFKEESQIYYKRISKENLLPSWTPSTASPTFQVTTSTSTSTTRSETWL